MVASSIQLPFYGLASTSFVENPEESPAVECENPADSLHVGSDVRMDFLLKNLLKYVLQIKLLKAHQGWEHLFF